MDHRPDNGNALIPCAACGQRTEVTRQVHADVGLHGMTIPCWACRAEMTIPPTQSRVDHERRQMVNMGVALIASGDIERGKATLKASEKL